MADTKVKNTGSDIFVDLLIDSLPPESQVLGPIESVTLSWVERSRPRRRCWTDHGTEIALALPRGSVLSHGTILHNSPQRTIVVAAADEDVIVVRPASQLEMCIVSHHLGNWHRSLQLEEDGSLVIEIDEPLLKWLEYRKIKFSSSHRPYHPNLKGSAHG